MNKKETKALRIGDRVRWRDWTPEHDEAQRGTVVAKLALGFSIRWDDGLELDYRYNTTNDTLIAEPAVRT